MLKDRRKLETELTKYFASIDKTKIVNRQLQQQWYAKLSSDYNIPMVDSSDYLSLRKDLSGATEFVLYAITNVVKEDLVQKYFSQKEIDLFKGQKLKVDDIKTTFRLPMLRVADDQYIGVTSVKFLMQLREDRLINYNANTQRALAAMLVGDDVVYRPYVNNYAVTEIAEAFKQNVFIPNTISLNISLDDERADYEFFPKDNILEIRDITAFDIFDGYHRYLGMARIWDLNHDFDYPMELRITMFSVSKAKQFIFQEDHKTKMRKLDAKTFNQGAYGNQVINRINTDPDSCVIGRINLTGGLIHAGVMSQSIDKFYFDKKKTYNRKDINDIAQNIMTNLDKFLLKYDEYDKNKWSKSVTHTIMYGISSGRTSEEIYSALQKIPDNLESKLAGDRLHLSAVKIIKEVYGDDE